MHPIDAPFPTEESEMCPHRNDAIYTACSVQRMALMGAIVAGLIASGAGVATYAYFHQSCTVGIAGTDVQVTAVGSDARGFCSSFIDSSNGAGYYADPNPNLTLMCRYNIRSEQVTVRDRGTFKFVGLAECQALASQQ